MIFAFISGWKEFFDCFPLFVCQITFVICCLIFFFHISYYTTFLLWTQALIKPILQGAKYRSLEEKREQINAVFYLVKTGCQWRNLPKDFPKWKTVYSFYRRACLNGIWDKIQKALVKKVRLAKCKKETPGYALIDSQSAETVS